MSLEDFAGEYAGQFLFGGWNGNWGNGGVMSFSISCDGDLLVNGAAPDSYAFDGSTSLLTWTTSSGSTRVTLSETVTNDYYYRDLTTYPGNTCTGGCFTGVFNGLDYRGAATSRTTWYVHFNSMFSL